MKLMDFFVWQERSRERSREFGQPAARLRSSARLQAHTHLQGSSGKPLAGVAAPACKPVCALQAQEE